MSTVTAISFKPSATRKRLKKEILSDDFKKGKIFWKNIAENFLENFPYGKIFYGKFPPHITTPGVINTEAWSSRLGVGRRINNPAV
jgi:hypothetical protein